MNIFEVLELGSIVASNDDYGLLVTVNGAYFNLFTVNGDSFECIDCFSTGFDNGLYSDNDIMKIQDTAENIIVDVINGGDSE